jgi:hypothetical protein
LQRRPAQHHQLLGYRTSPTSIVVSPLFDAFSSGGRAINTVDMSQKAVDLKNQGNKAFGHGDYPAAVDLYTKAIELNDKEPLFFTNRAQVCSRHMRLNCG